MSNEGQFVIIRTTGAGVHCGTLEKEGKRSVTLTNARRIWRWRGANTLHEMALRGASLTEFTRISEPVESITIRDVHEIIPCTDAAQENLTQSRWLS